MCLEIIIVKDLCDNRVKLYMNRCQELDEPKIFGLIYSPWEYDSPPGSRRYILLWWVG